MRYRLRRNRRVVLARRVPRSITCSSPRPPSVGQALCAFGPAPGVARPPPGAPSTPALRRLLVRGHVRHHDPKHQSPTACTALRAVPRPAPSDRYCFSSCLRTFHEGWRPIWHVITWRKPFAARLWLHQPHPSLGARVQQRCQAVKARCAPPGGGGLRPALTACPRRHHLRHPNRTPYSATPT